MKKMVWIIGLVCCSLSLLAQPDSSFRYLMTIKGDISQFAVDNLDNIYLLSSQNQLKKLKPDGDSAAIFNDVKRFGQASLIDVSNPLKVLLYYENFSSIVMLDRFLNVRNSIDLRKQNIFQVKAIGQSYDNKIWLYDEVNNRLKKIDEDGKLMLETPDFRQLFDEAPSPQYIFDKDQFVYLYDSTRAIYVFDYFGTLKNKILISGWQNLELRGNYIYGTQGDSLYRYNTRTFRTEEWLMPAPLRQSQSIHFGEGRVYALKGGRIEVYALK
jgi:hypothetical protein